MAANTLFSAPFLYVVDANGKPVVGAKATFFSAGTTTPLTVYTDAGRTTAWTQPIVTNASGQSAGPVYVSPTPAILIVIVDANNVSVPGFPVDNWSPSAVAT